MMGAQWGERKATFSNANAIIQHEFLNLDQFSELENRAWYVRQISKVKETQAESHVKQSSCSKPSTFALDS